LIIEEGKKIKIGIYTIMYWKSVKKLVEAEMGFRIDQICFVSVAGFREETLRFAEESNVRCIELNVLNTLLKKYGMRRIDELETCT
jgi:hypothetical protein